MDVRAADCEDSLEDFSENATPVSHFDTLAQKISLSPTLKNNNKINTFKTIFIYVSDLDKKKLLFCS